jgi:hypothetical protein
MKRVKVFLLAFVALSALAGILSGSALALPTLLFLGTEQVPLLINSLGNATTPTELQNTGGSAIKGEGITLEITFLTASSNLGQFLARFRKTFKEKAAFHCFTTGLTEEINVHGEVHLVYDSLSPLGVATLFLVPEFEISCKEGAEPVLEVKVKGSVLGLVKPINTEIGTTEHGEGIQACGGKNESGKAGKPVETKYWNESGTELHPALESEFGSGFKASCQLIGATTTSSIPLTPTKMVEIMG